MPCTQKSSGIWFQQQLKYELLPDRRGIHNYFLDLFKLKPMHTTAGDALGALTVYVPLYHFFTWTWCWKLAFCLLVSQVSQVPLLKGMEQRHAPSIVPAPRPPVLATAAQDNPPPERPPIDLFKSCLLYTSPSPRDS